MTRDDKWFERDAERVEPSVRRFDAAPWLAERRHACAMGAASTVTRMRHDAGRHCQRMILYIQLV
ncbi:hypothetical protein L0Y88_05670 [Burkholderia multivorans]|jgi:hypothetical protein|uniref:hypothetical protein n=1 Tax=Burkholderia multivorans TaxID=87883 RepID=UPI0005BDF9BA|nr:hypothetical protein [Burkholderia multivorans]KOE25727.1 hypothetical protein AI46_10845 [Burkholderia multivorans R-20526]MCL4654505.1 hypothetical protein [Burkholderia multivorans]UQN53574.1 hypothetical protein L0Y88_05670 [Burkholderia multivorans]UQN82082.1 hypothetical protein L0Z18_22930 [Burkholderia multivorans]